MYSENFFKIVMICFIAIVLFSCKGDKNDEFKSVLVTDIYTDSIKIHALSPIDENRVWFAGSRGKVGLIDSDIPKLAIIKYEDKYLHFRSLAATDESIFVLSIASPAVLYKIGFEGNEATNIENTYLETGEKVFYNSMKFWNNLEGIAVGDPIDSCLSIIVTRDGGNSWTKIACDKLPEAEKGEVAFAASNSNIAILGEHTWIATGGAKSRVLYSPDKGETWSIYETPIVSGEALTGIHSISFWDDRNGIIAGGNSKIKTAGTANIAITNDGGKTWTLEASGENFGYISSVKYVPNGQGKKIVGLGPTGISFSKDGGQSWKLLSEEQGLFALEFVNDSTAFASGKHRIAKLIFQK